MKKKIIGIFVCMLLTTTVVSATNINVKNDVQKAASGVDVPVWTVGDSWTYNEQYVNHLYNLNGALVYLWIHNCTSTYTVNDATGDNYKLEMSSTNNEGQVMIGKYHFKFTKSTMLTGELSLRKTDLGTVSRSVQEKGLVYWLIGNTISIPAQYNDAWEGSYSPPDVTLPFPLAAGTNGALPNVSYTGHEKCSIYWGLFTLYNWPEVIGWTGEQNYMCEMADITVPAGNYDAYNVSIEQTYGDGTQGIVRSYYVPEVGWMAKQISDIPDFNGEPGFIFKSELVSTTYSP